MSQASRALEARLFNVATSSINQAPDSALNPRQLKRRNAVLRRGTKASIAPQTSR